MPESKCGSDGQQSVRVGLYRPVSTSANGFNTAVSRHVLPTGSDRVRIQDALGTERLSFTRLSLQRETLVVISQVLCKP